MTQTKHEMAIAHRQSYRAVLFLIVTLKDNPYQVYSGGCSHTEDGAKAERNDLTKTLKKEQR